MTPEQQPSTGPSEFGRWLYDARNKKGWSVPELAEESGVSFVQVYNIEAGRSQNPQNRTREKLIKALGESPPAALVKATETAATVEGIGEFIDFDPHDENDIPDGAGIYVFYDISDRPIYVGQSQDIRSRILRDHNSRFWFRAPVVQSAAYVLIADKTLRRQIEAVMIQFLKSNAVINKQLVYREE
jgi:transcriptional regulator with XRE-family HTH domain